MFVKKKYVTVPVITVEPPDRVAVSRTVVPTETVLMMAPLVSLMAVLRVGVNFAVTFRGSQELLALLFPGSPL